MMFDLQPNEIIVDNFAGGGGASTGILMATGRHPDVAINHDAEAVAMHAANHPTTIHHCQNVWKVDPLDAVRIGGKRRPVGLAWFSPDCKHFSKAKGGQPVKRNIRDLAWVVVHWAQRVKPRIIGLENVEEFRDWGPLIETEGGRLMPCPVQKGVTFRRWVRELKREGYRVEWRELRGCDYGSPTIRKRLFVLARCDGKPIVWPESTHGDPKGEAVKSGRLLPWRTAAECIDWSIGCPSIFERERPLAEATMARIARGVWRYVLTAADPFIVPVTHQGDQRVHSVDDPLRTITTAQRGEHAVVQPFLAGVGGRMGQSAERPVDAPYHTNTTKADTVVVSPTLMSYYGEGDGGTDRSRRPDEPIPVIPTENRHALVSSTLIQTGYGERPGQEPRVPGLDKPLGTVVAGGAKHAVVAASLTRFTQNGDGQGMDEPADTVMPGATKFGVVAAHLQRDFGKSTGSPANDPVGTITGGGGGKAALVSSFLAQHNTDMVGHDARKPLSTIVQKGCTQAVVSAGMINLKGSDRRQSAVEQPAPTVTAGGWHIGEVRAFLVKYYSEGGQDQSLKEPMHTTTTKARMGLVTVAGVEYQVADIGMRMLTPRELFRAQGFPDSYVIDPIYEGKPLTKTAQIRMCGNSVCPQVAAALVRAMIGTPAAAAAGVAD